MIWRTTGDKWLDKWISRAVEFTNGLDTPICKLSERDKADVKACMQRLCAINNRNPFNESYSK